jgi:hypothetical protein
MPNMRGYRSSSWLLAGTVALVAACTAGAPPSLSAQQSGQTGQPAGAVQAQDQQQQDPLGLSDQQKKQLAETFQALRPNETQQQTMKQIQQLLLADKVDVAGLTTALDSSRQSLVQNVDKVISMFQGLRQVLDENQRNKLVSLMQQQDNQPAQPQFPHELNLSQQQQAALAALQPDQRKMNQALIDFLQSADQKALREAITNDLAAMPKPGIIAAALAGLNHDQRQKMFAPPQQGQPEQGPPPQGQSQP